MTVRRLLHHCAEGFMAFCLLIMVIAVFGNVVLRYVWGTGWLVSEELARLLFVWLVSISAALAFGEGKHLGFDMVTSRLTGLPAAVLRWLTRTLIGVSLYYLIVGSWQQVLVGLNTRSPVMNYPLALAAGGILAMGVAMAALLLLQCWVDLRGDARPQGHADQGSEEPRPPQRERQR